MMNASLRARRNQNCATQRRHGPGVGTWRDSRGRTSRSRHSNKDTERTAWSWAANLCAQARTWHCASIARRISDGIGTRAVAMTRRSRSTQIESTVGTRGTKIELARRIDDAQPPKHTQNIVPHQKIGGTMTYAAVVRGSGSATEVPARGRGATKPKVASPNPMPSDIPTANASPTHSLTLSGDLQQKRASLLPKSAGDANDGDAIAT